MDAGVAEAIIKKSALKFLEHISANTSKFILIDFNFAKTLKHPDSPHWLLLSYLDVLLF